MGRLSRSNTVKHHRVSRTPRTEGQKKMQKTRSNTTGCLVLLEKRRHAIWPCHSSKLGSLLDSPEAFASTTLNLIKVFNALALLVKLPLGLQLVTVGHIGHIGQAVLSLWSRKASAVARRAKCTNARMLKGTTHGQTPQGVSWTSQVLQTR